MIVRLGKIIPSSTADLPGGLGFTAREHLAKLCATSIIWPLMPRRSRPGLSQLLHARSSRATWLDAFFHAISGCSEWLAVSSVLLVVLAVPGNLRTRPAGGYVNLSWPRGDGLIWPRWD